MCYLFQWQMPRCILLQVPHFSGLIVSLTDKLLVKSGSLTEDRGGNGIILCSVRMERSQWDTGWRQIYSSLSLSTFFVFLFSFFRFRRWPMFFFHFLIFLCFKPLSRIPYGYSLIYTVLWNLNMHVYVFLFQPILRSVTFLRFNAHACMYMYMSTMSCLSTWRNCALIRIYAYLG